MLSMNSNPALQACIIQRQVQILCQISFQRCPLQRCFIAAGQHVGNNAPGHILRTIPPCACNPGNRQISSVFRFFLRRQLIVNRSLRAFRLLIGKLRMIDSFIIGRKGFIQQGQHFLHGYGSVEVNPGIAGVIAAFILPFILFISQIRDSPPLL